VADVLLETLSADTEETFVWRGGWEPVEREQRGGITSSDPEAGGPMEDRFRMRALMEYPETK